MKEKSFYIKNFDGFYLYDNFDTIKEAQEYVENNAETINKMDCYGTIEDEDEKEIAEYITDKSNKVWFKFCKN